MGLDEEPQMERQGVGEQGRIEETYEGRFSEASEPRDGEQEYRHGEQHGRAGGDGRWNDELDMNADANPGNLNENLPREDDFGDRENEQDGKAWSSQEGREKQDVPQTYNDPIREEHQEKRQLRSQVGELGDAGSSEHIILISNLPHKVNEDDLVAMLKDVGAVKVDEKTGTAMVKFLGRPKDGKLEAEVVLEDSRSASHVVKWFDGYDFQGSNIAVALKPAQKQVVEPPPHSKFSDHHHSGSVSRSRSRSPGRERRRANRPSGFHDAPRDYIDASRERERERERERRDRGGFDDRGGFQAPPPRLGRGGPPFARGGFPGPVNDFPPGGVSFGRNNPNVPPREGDWICPDPTCGNLNFARRTRCNQCMKTRHGPGSIGLGGGGPVPDLPSVRGPYGGPGGSIGGGMGRGGIGRGGGFPGFLPEVPLSRDYGRMPGIRGGGFDFRDEPPLRERERPRDLFRDRERERSFERGFDRGMVGGRYGEREPERMPERYVEREREFDRFGDRGAVVDRERSAFGRVGQEYGAAAYHRERSRGVAAPPYDRLRESERDYRPDRRGLSPLPRSRGRERSRTPPLRAPSREYHRGDGGFGGGGFREPEYRRSSRIDDRRGRFDDGY
eukprot:jgi/Mesen1/504/ME000104S10592